ncbi:DMT family transporter [Roseitranquillus sediminis]|uniref:DMT family transporter n=1 Tax=Roseitranquillus sediminis TaxID=2809051 RepID=UPI001D0C3478|nr:DMT family transporter [Roseitranquillus sediminis]MBM9595535.1 DMT family transporter [Roseitranquillus sediminis]
MTGAIVSFSSMAVAGREVSLELDTFEIMLYRSLLGIALVLGVASVAGTLRQVRANRMGLHLVRNVSHFTGQNLWFFAITAAPLAQVFALEFSQPLWVALLAPLILAEHLNRARVFAAVTGFLGILIVARPGAEPISAGLVAAALAAIGFAGSALTTKLLTRTETITSILFWLTVMQATFGLICAGIDGSITLPSPGNWPWVGVIACAGLLAHFCLTQALSLAPATVVIPLDFARLPVIAIVGMLLYGEPLETPVFLGAAVIFAAIYLNVWNERRRRGKVVTER